MELPQWGLVHRHRGVPALVVPFFFIGSVHMGHRVRFVVTRKVNQQLLYHRWAYFPCIESRKADNNGGDIIIVVFMPSGQQ